MMTRADRRSYDAKAKANARATLKAQGLEATPVAVGRWATHGNRSPEPYKAWMRLDRPTMNARKAIAVELAA